MASGANATRVFENLSTLSTIPDFAVESATTNETNISTAAFTNPEDPENFLPMGLVNLYKFCVYYAPVIIWIVSFPANMFIIYILMQKKIRNFSTSIYFTSLAVADLLVNFITLTGWLNMFNDVMYGSTFECKLVLGLILVGMVGSSWTLAVISIERMLSVYLLQRVKVLCKSNFAKVCVFCIWMLSLAVGSVQAWFYEFSGTHCVIKATHLALYRNHMTYILFILDIVFPFFLISVNSILIVSRLVFIKSRSTTSSKAFGKSVTVLVLVVNLVFLITQFPYGVMYVVHRTTGQYASKQRFFMVIYLLEIFLTLKYINHGINFYLYFLTASKFRKEAKDRIVPCARCLCRVWKRRERAESS